MTMSRELIDENEKNARNDCFRRYDILLFEYYMYIWSR